MRRIAAWVLTIALMLGGVGRAAGQADPGGTVAQPETSVGAVLRNLASRSGVVFVGQVVRIERKPGTVEIVFQVQQPVLGAVGATYTLREWGGLWAGGQQRYRLGQRAMIFLHAANGAGLSSPVDGMEGVVPVVVQGADTGALLDVRWLAARVLRAEGAPIADAENGAITVAEAAAVAAGWKSSESPEPVRRPLPVGVRPVVAAPGLGAGIAGRPGRGAGTGQPGLGAGIAGESRPQPVLGSQLRRSPQSAGSLKMNGVHDMVQAAAPGGPDAIR